MTDLSAFELGEKSGQTFRESVVADLGGSTGPYSESPASRYSGTGRGRPGSRAGNHDRHRMRFRG